MRLPSLERQQTPRGGGNSEGAVAALLARARMALHNLQKVAIWESQLQWEAPLMIPGSRNGSQLLRQREPTGARAGPAPRMWLPLA